MRNAVVSILTACALLVLPCAAGAAPGDTRYTHPGTLSPVSPYLNVYCTGSAGEGASGARCLRAGGGTQSGEVA